MVAVRFESAKWTAELGRAEGAFDALDCLVTDKSAVGVHLESGAAGKTAGMLAAGFRKIGISNAHSIHRRQMIVLAVTVLESAIENFLAAFFECKPPRVRA